MFNSPLGDWNIFPCCLSRCNSVWCFPTQTQQSLTVSYGVCMFRPYDDKCVATVHSFLPPVSMSEHAKTTFSMTHLHYRFHTGSKSIKMLTRRAAFVNCLLVICPMRQQHWQIIKSVCVSVSEWLSECVSEWMNFGTLHNLWKLERLKLETPNLAHR